MSGQDPGQPSRPSTSIPNQPYQILDANSTFTPYYTTSEEAKRFHPNHVTPYLHNNLYHPPQNFPEPRNQFPGTDPITEVRKRDGERAGEMSSEQVAAMRDVKTLTKEERHACDKNEFSVAPPNELSQAQKQRWAQWLTELLGKKDNQEDDQDPHKLRPRGELRKLKQLADLAGGKQK